MTSTDFEQQVARIVTVLEGQGAEVTWNARIPDPDNPDQPRQIDVLIRRGGDLSIVECRLHSRPQDVTWVEELAGRRASLNAAMVIGVSSSGFTAGAKKKAARLGVFLRSLVALSDDEVRNWGRKTTVRLSYVHFRKAAIHLVPTDAVILPRVDRRTMLLKQDGSPWELQRLFNAAVDRVGKDGVPEGVINLQCFTSDLYVGSVPVREFVLQVDWRWVHRELSLPVVLSYAPPESDLLAGDALVERDSYSATEMFHSKEGIFAVIDMSLAPNEPNSMIKSALIDLGQSLPLKGVALVGSYEEKTTLLGIALHVCRRNSSQYRALLSGPMLEP